MDELKDWKIIKRLLLKLEKQEKSDLVILIVDSIQYYEKHQVIL